MELKNIILGTRWGEERLLINQELNGQINVIDGTMVNSTASIKKNETNLLIIQTIKLLVSFSNKELENHNDILSNNIVSNNIGIDLIKKSILINNQINIKSDIINILIWMINKNAIEMDTISILASLKNISPLLLNNIEIQNVLKKRNDYIQISIILNIEHNGFMNTNMQSYYNDQSFTLKDRLIILHLFLKFKTI